MPCGEIAGLCRLLAAHTSQLVLAQALQLEYWLRVRLEAMAISTTTITRCTTAVVVGIALQKVAVGIALQKASSTMCACEWAVKYSGHIAYVIQSSIARHPVSEPVPSQCTDLTSLVLPVGGGRNSQAASAQVALH